MSWAGVREALKRVTGEAGALPLWWRDDDATRLSPALERLAAQARAAGVPVHLAIVPAQARPELAGLGPEFIPVVHGWAHANHEPPGRKKAEFGAARTGEAVERDLREGLARLAFLGARLRRMFVPPWNRIDPAHVMRVREAGHEWISTFGPRARREPVPGLVCINTHVDPIDWHGTRSLADEEALLARLAAHLRDRADGRADPAEPLGLLTHHLDHDPAIEGFVARFWEVMRAAPHTLWTPPDPGEPDEPT